mgnify:CR=1 FL=1
MSPYIYALIAVTIVSLVSLVGVFTLSLSEQHLKKNIFTMVSLAIGAMLGDAFIHIIPEALESSLGSTMASILVIVGILIFFIVEKFLHWHHHGEDAHLDHIHPVGKLVIFSDGIHNFIDGVLIGASFLISIPVGIATTIAVVLHEIPQEIGDFGVLLHAGYPKKRALWLNFLSGLLAVAGVGVALALGSASESFALFILPLAAGGFIYIAMADLIPELQKSKGARQSAYQILAIAIGVLAMIALIMFE